MNGLHRYSLDPLKTSTFSFWKANNHSGFSELLVSLWVSLGVSVSPI